MIHREMFEKENPKSGSGVTNVQATHKTASSFVLNRTPIEVTPVKRLPLGNLTENTPTSITSSRVVLSGAKEKKGAAHGNHSRGSIFSGAVRVPKKEKSVGHNSNNLQTNVTQTNDPSQPLTPRAAYHPTPPRTTAHTVTPTRSSAKKSTSGHKSKHSYMQTTEAYR